mgnify:CR=1 FL=1
MAKLLLFASKQCRHPLPGGQDPDDAGCVRMALHVVEQHSGAIHIGGPHDSSSGSHMAVNTGELGLRIDLHICLNQLSGNLPQDRKRVPQGENIGSVVHGKTSLEFRVIQAAEGVHGADAGKGRIPQQLGKRRCDGSLRSDRRASLLMQSTS